jgi:hypothetical protein
MPFPSPPWHMRAQLWLSVFRATDTGREDRPAGIHCVGFASYEEGSPLTYRELVVARVLDARRRTVRVTDIWVDSEESLRGGRSLWAIPKELACLDLEDSGLGPAVHTRLAAAAGGEEIATGEFVSVPRAALVRTPYSALTSQLRDGGTVLTPLRGSAKGVPALATWQFAAGGPLGYLRGRRPLVSFRLRDVRLTFG